MKNYLERAITFAKYEQLMDDLIEAGKTTGPNQTESLIGYTKLNRQRMHRLTKTVEITDETRQALRLVTRPMIWLIITEAWCGDAAQNIPVIEKIAAENDKIETRYILRDENLELMDMFLTNGARAIPKLIALDKNTLDVIGTWGSRPDVAQKIFVRMREEGTEKPVIMEEMQRWYNADRGVSLQHEFAGLVDEWNQTKSATAVS